MLIDEVVGNAIDFLAEEDCQLRSIHKVLALLLVFITQDYTWDGNYFAKNIIRNT